jgi:hypothetical protein
MLRIVLPVGYQNAFTGNYDEAVRGKHSIPRGRSLESFINPYVIRKFFNARKIAGPKTAHRDVGGPHDVLLRLRQSGECAQAGKRKSYGNTSSIVHLRHLTFPMKCITFRHQEKSHGLAPGQEL